MTLELRPSDRARAARTILQYEPALVPRIIHDPAADRDIAERLRILMTNAEARAHVEQATTRIPYVR